MDNKSAAASASEKEDHQKEAERCKEEKARRDQEARALQIFLHKIGLGSRPQSRSTSSPGPSRSPSCAKKQE